MRVLSSITNVCATRMKLLLRRTSTMRHCFCDNFNLCSISSSSNERNVDDVDDGVMTSIMLILSKRPWSLDCQNGYNIYRNYFNVVQILDYLFEESLDANLALCFFKWSECCTGSKHTLWTICRMVHILVSGNMKHRALDLLRLLVRNYAEEEMCGLLLEVLYGTHNEKRVLEIVCSMLVDQYIKEGMVNLALNVTDGMKQLKIFPTGGVCNTLLRVLLKLNKLDSAWDFLEILQTRGGLNSSIINLFIRKFCSEGDLRSGFKFPVEMKKCGIQPDVVSYTIIIHSLCKMSYTKEATMLLFKMLQMGITPDSVLISSIIHGHCQLKQREAAIKILKTFRPPLNIFVYTSFISNLCSDGNMHEASGLFLEMSEFGLVPDCVCYSTIIGAYCKVKDMNRAFLYFGKMLKGGITPLANTYTLLIDAYCKSGDTEMAEHVFHVMLSEGVLPDIVTYNTLMDGYGRKGQLQKVFGVLDMINSSSVSPDVVTYNTLIHSLATRGFANEAKQIMIELIRRGFSLDVASFTNVIDGFSKKGNFEEAFFVWFCMSEHDVKPDVVTCSALLNGYCRKHQMEQANVLFRKMLDIGLHPDLILYNTLIRGFCSVGSIDDACNLICMMVENGIIPNHITHQALVLGFRKAGVRNPILVAAHKLQDILLRYGIPAAEYLIAESCTHFGASLANQSVDQYTENV
ncbi:pentatricopeptide repeat-containing protein At2g19280 [Argentina anserina]|uniref:pentatricopeptide repeat-containing protein At2g19280 n=1 Tax=Argentina anserina TaxID=57926 RepID=UPI00217651DD|nr:pentatricopeptide repeat-containing protein At2g19280 [Potentilla anserina]